MKGNLFLAMQQHWLAWTTNVKTVEERDEIKKPRRKLGNQMKRERNSCRVRANRMREKD